MPGDVVKQRASAKVLVVDDHPIVRHGLGQLIASQPDMELCGQADCIAEAMRVLKTTSPDVVVVDLSLGDESGIDLIKYIRAERPDIKVLVSSIHDEETFAPRVLRAGACGYIEKREAIRSILDAIRTVLRGEIFLQPHLAGQLLQRALGGKPLNSDPVSLLSDREFEVFELLGNGMTVKQVAHRLKISPKTVESHREKIKDKLKLKNSAQLAHCAINWVHEQH